MKNSFRKATAIAIEGPPIIVDGISYLYYKAKSRLLPEPKLEKVTTKIDLNFTRNGCTVSNFSVHVENYNSLLKATIAMIETAESLNLSYENLMLSIRSFKAAYKGVRIWEIPLIQI